MATEERFAAISGRVISHEHDPPILTSMTQV